MFKEQYKNIKGKIVYKMKKDKTRQGYAYMGYEKYKRVQEDWN